MSDRFRAYLFLHSAVLLFGLTGIFGKLIELPETTIVWYRTLLTVLSLLFFPDVLRNILSLPRVTILSLMGIGVLVALHWTFFFGAIQLTNVSITLSVLATGSFFTSILEPVILRTKVRWYQILLGLTVVPGVWFIYQGSEDNGNLGLGILTALLSTLLASLFGILNKKMVAKYNPVSITFLELLSGCLVLSMMLPLWYATHPLDAFLPVDWNDWVFLCLLAWLCTTYAFMATLKALKMLSAFVVSLSINLEPVYSIIIAFFIFHEQDELYAGFFVGAGIILLSVFLHPLLERWLERPVAEELES